MALLDQTASIIMRDQFSQTFSSLHTKQQQAGKGFDDMGNASKRAGGALSGLSGVAGALGISLGAAGVIGAGKAAIELGNLGAQSLVTKQSFESVTASVGKTTALLDQMKAAAGGTIDELRLMQLANTALAGASGETGAAFADLIPRLIEGARAANKLNPALGDTEFLFQSLVTGIKRGSPLLIDNTGITLSIAEANQRMADSLGKSVTALTEEEKQLALMGETAKGVDRILQQSGGSLDTMAVSADKLKTSFQNLKVAIGEGLAPLTSQLQAGLATELDAVAAKIGGDTTGQLAAELQRAEAEIVTYTAQLNELGDSTQRGAKALRENLSEGLAEATQRAANLRTQLAAMQMTKQEQEARRLAGAMLDLSAAEREAGVSAEVLARRARQGGDGLIYMAQTARMARGSLAGLSSEYKAFLESGKSSIISTGVSSGMDNTAILSNIAEFQRKAAQIELDFGPGNSTNKRIALERLRDQFQKSAQDFKASLNDMSGAADDTFNEIAGMIDSILQPSFSLSELAPDLATQEGNIDEHYRRLAAIALRGGEELTKHAQDWQDTLSLIPPDVQAQGVAAIQEWAKAQVQAYDAGLDFSLIDKGAIKDRILRQLQANEARDAVIAEIAASLGNISMADVEAAAKDAGLGGEGGKGTIGKISLGIEDSVDVDAMLRTTAAAITSGAQDKHAKALRESGKVVGGVILGGITTAVTEGAGDIINLLAAAVAPSVLSAVEARNRRTGGIPPS